MSLLDVKFDWAAPLGARGAELRATWAELSISVSGESVTRVWDANVRAVSDRVFMPLYPLAEWIASKWIHYRVLHRRSRNGLKALDAHGPNPPAPPGAGAPHTSATPRVRPVC